MAAADFAKGIGLSFDYMDYNTRNKKLIITRNPFGFVRDYDPVSAKYRGVVRRGDPSAVVGGRGSRGGRRYFRYGFNLYRKRSSLGRRI